jgi:hypothetical protein
LVKTPELQDHEIFLMGPRLEGFISLLIAQFRHSHGSVRAFIGLLFPDLHLSQGLISKAKKRAAKAFDQAAQELAEALLADAGPKYLDFTGWRHEGQNWNSLIIRNKTLLRYFLREKQSGKVVEEILNKGRHKVVCDRGLALGETDIELLQYCLAHLQRNFQGMAEDEQITQEETQVLGEIYETLQMLFHDRHRYDRNEISVETFRQYGYQKWAWIKEELETLLECTLCAKLRRFCKKALKGWKHFMAYLSQAGPMTNNLAEEGLRNLVIARKLCFGSRSSYGLKWRESVHSCVETLKRQGKSVLDFFAETIRAFRIGAPCPKIV